MTAQLILIDTDEPSWKIPEATREIGRKGLAEARAVLRSIPRREPADASADQHHSHPAAA